MAACDRLAVSAVVGEAVMSQGLPREGTRRLSIGLGILAVIGCAIAYVLIVTLRGPPFWFGWWIVMALLLAASFLFGRVLAPLLEWIIAGYTGGPDTPRLGSAP
jgi:hypothetical protein